ncbi:MAG: hypothetical protein QM757_26585 [Paludibaculum sp.]
MPCSLTVAAQLTQEFSVFSVFRFMDQKAQTTLARAIAEASVSAEHAREIVRNWLKTEDDCPTPAALYEMSKIVPVPHPKQADPPPHCERCASSGRYSAWAVVDIFRRPSGEPYRRTVREIPPLPGRENEYLVYRPRFIDEAGQVQWWDGFVDGINQNVGIFSVFCTCELGRQKKQAVLARQATEGDEPVRRKQRRRKGGDD